MLVRHLFNTGPDRVGSWLAAVLAAFIPALLIALTTQIGFADDGHSLHQPQSPRDSDGGSQTVGDDVELEGTLEILHEDRPDGGRYQHVLTTGDGTRWSVEGVQQAWDLLTGDRVRIKGHRSGKTIQLQQSSSTGSSSVGLQVLAAAPLSNTFGPQKTVVLLVNFSNDQSQPAAIADVQSLMTWSDEFFRESSYGQTSLSFDVFGWYTLPISNDCSTSNIKTYAEQAATAAGVNLSLYARHVYLFPVIWTCGFTGASTVGGNPSSSWINGLPTIGTLNHELGHSFGLYHSHSLKCQPGIVGPSCSADEYGDAFDTMGRGYGHFNAFQKTRLGWLDYNVSPPVTTVQTSGTYAIDAYESAGATPKALKIPRGTTGQSFFVELRRNVGWDTYLYRSGVYVHLATDADPNSSYLLDMTPATISFSDDALLDVGKSFTDPYSGLTITTVSVSSTSATVMVDTGSSCTRSGPTVTASPGQSPAVEPGTTVTYNVSVTNTDSAGCSPSSFTLQATVPTGWQKSFGASVVTIGPGATASTTLQVTSPSVPPGSYTIVGAATNSTASTLSGTASVLYTVATDGSGTAGTFTDSFDRADSTTLGNGWTEVGGDLMIVGSQLRNAPAPGVHRAVVPALAGAIQTAAASFASVDNNAGPRFGVFLRYQNAQNYYVCYRQTGGASLLRIAKVVNGVETVLKSVSISNPQTNVFFRLGCRAQGTTLTLSLDGASKVSVSNATFSSGSVGILIGAGTTSSQLAKSHRADNFSATAQ